MQLKQAGRAFLSRDQMLSPLEVQPLQWARREQVSALILNLLFFFTSQDEEEQILPGKKETPGAPQNNRLVRLSS